MVGHRFCERLTALDEARTWQIITFCEEPRPAYDRVNLTKYFEHRTADKLALGRCDWYAEQGIELDTGRPVVGPPRRPLQRIQLEIRDDTVFATGVELRTV